MEHMPKVDISKYHISETKRKSDYIIRMLFDYGVGTARDTVKIIEEQGVDKFNFDYPYGSFEEYKKHVLAGEFDSNFDSMLMTPEKKAEQDRAVAEGRMRIQKEHLMPRY